MNQLYGTKNRDAIAHAVKALWAERIASRFTISTLPEYRDESFRGLKAQVDHRNWVLDQIKTWHGAPHIIGRACYVHRVLPEHEVFLEYDQERLDKAKAEITVHGPAPDEFCKVEQPYPSCFGLPGAPDPAGDECQKCPAFRGCLIVQAGIVKTFKTDDPVLSRHKALGRNRTKKFRAKRASFSKIERDNSS